MPIHDWTRVEAGIFHDFHHGWVEEIKRALNSGILPDDYYALAEQSAGGFGPDVQSLQGPRAVSENGSSPAALEGTGLLLAPPKVEVTAETDMEFYRRKQSTVTVRHVSGDRVVAMVEVVSPNNKRAMKNGGHEHTGFEEIARHYTGAKRSIQILMGRKYNLARVTNHVPLRQVADICTRERVFGQIKVLKDSLAMVGLNDPVIGVSGLNPHNGEHGLMGTEEMTDIGPACDDARAEGLRVIGPIPADTVFVDIDTVPSPSPVVPVQPVNAVAMGLLDTGLRLADSSSARMAQK